MNESVGALVSKGNSMVDRGEFEEAIKFYDQALEIDPKDVVALANKGTALDQLGKYREAVECFDKVLEINKKDVEALNNKGSSLIRLGKYSEAIKHFNDALAVSPYNFVTHYNKGLALGKLGKYGEAIKSYDESLKIVPDYAIAIYSKAATLLDLASTLSCDETVKKTEEAYKLFETVWSLKDTIPDKGNQLKISLSASSADIFLHLVERCGSEGIRVARKIKEFLCSILDQKRYADFIEEIQLSLPADLKQYSEVIALLDEPCPKSKK
ncbi:MAG: tetratricopeptide repeat protein [Candidatus Jordarchaeum sp.]|uniref:tetratricopeptide repeat protein n=1 Tax=Candidatus Jordarchaeum sp. TaxID=2823881 RepID=UPI004048ECEB